MLLTKSRVRLIIISQVGIFHIVLVMAYFNTSSVNAKEINTFQLPCHHQGCSVGFLHRVFHVLAFNACFCVINHEKFAAVNACGIKKKKDD